MRQSSASILGRISEMSRKGGFGNAEQFRRAPLVAICSLVNKTHMQSNCAWKPSENLLLSTDAGLNPTLM
jgi:hypothetical protein